MNCVLENQMVNGACFSELITYTAGLLQIVALFVLLEGIGVCVTLDILLLTN